MAIDRPNCPELSGKTVQKRPSVSMDSGRRFSRFSRGRNRRKEEDGWAKIAARLSGRDKGDHDWGGGGGTVAMDLRNVSRRHRSDLKRETSGTV